MDIRHIHTHMNPKSAPAHCAGVIFPQGRIFQFLHGLGTSAALLYVIFHRHDLLTCLKKDTRRSPIMLSNISSTQTEKSTTTTTLPHPRTPGFLFSFRSYSYIARHDAEHRAQSTEHSYLCFEWTIAWVWSLHGIYGIVVFSWWIGSFSSLVLPAMAGRLTLFAFFSLSDEDI